MLKNYDKKKLQFFRLSDDSVISVSKRCIRIGQTPGLHWHNYIEIELIVSGKGKHDLNGAEYPLGPGSVFILRPPDFHEITAETQLELYNISISESLLGRDTLDFLARCKSDITAKLNEDAFATSVSLFELMLKESNCKQPSHQILKNLLDCLILTVLKQFPALPPVKYSSSDAISAAITYTKMHFLDNPTLSDVAKVAHFNPSHFSTRFKETVGTSFSNYLCELKLNYSKQLLISTDFKVADIAFKSGFPSQSNFLRVFRNKTGTSPLKFRNKYRE